MVLDFGLLNSGLFTSSSVNGDGLGADDGQAKKNDVGAGGVVPIGAIIGWHKSFTNTPALLGTFVECNGQTLTDTDSVYNGQVIPDLNGVAANNRFLRGASTSGDTAGTASHTHTTTGSGSFGSGSSALTTQSHLPPYFNVVWIMRIK